MRIGNIILISLGLIAGTLVRFWTVPETPCERPSMEPSIPIENGEEEARITALVADIQSLRTDRPQGESEVAPRVAERGAAPTVGGPRDGIHATLDALRSTYEDAGQSRLYEKTYGVHVVAPLAIPREELEASRSQGHPRALPSESYVSAFMRLDAVNSKTPVLSGHTSGFQVLGYRTRGRMEVIPGGDLGEELLNPEELAAMLARACGRKFGDIKEEERSFLVRLCSELHVERERYSRDVWSAIHPEALTRSRSVSTSESDIVAFSVVQGRLFLIRHGLDPELDRYLHKLDELGRATQRRVQEVVR